MCHPRAGAMHGHEQCRETFGLLLANVEPLLSFAPFGTATAHQTPLENPFWISFELGGILSTGSCHHSPA